jgi:hypothetical protein
MEGAPAAKGAAGGWEATGRTRRVGWHNGFVELIQLTVHSSYPISKLRSIKSISCQLPLAIVDFICFKVLKLNIILLNGY